MNEAHQLYPVLLDASRAAFAGHLFSTAYHSLSGAMYCAVQLKDGSKLKEIEQLAREQYDALRTSSHEPAVTKEPIELSLYISLLQIVRTRIILVPK
ncbi:hypothetical protein EON83_17835 [bacterium]|nr:MAG: hypothetical protein EON83_17835 [bacterium]